MPPQNITPAEAYQQAMEALQNARSEYQDKVKSIENLERELKDIKKQNETFSKAADEIEALKLQVAELKKENTDFQQQLANPTWKIENGVINFVPYNTNNPFAVGTGSRTETISVKFSTGKFTTAPKVLVSLTSLDDYGGSPIRLNVYPEDITIRGFNLIIGTWADTKIAMVYCTWLAYSE